MKRLTPKKVIRTNTNEYVVLEVEGSNLVVCPVVYGDSNNHRSDYYLSFCAASKGGISVGAKIRCHPKLISVSSDIRFMGSIPTKSFNEICALAHCEIMSQRLEETPRIKPPSIYSW